MSIVLISVAAAAIWYALGVGGFVYWWTSDHDLGVAEAPLALSAGLFGPFAWLIGWIIHGAHGERQVLIRRRW